MTGWFRRLRKALAAYPYPPEAAEVPDPVAEAYAEHGFAYAVTPWTAQQRTELAALDGERGASWAVETVLEARISEAVDRYRRGFDLGGARELSAVSSWTNNGWVLDSRVSPP